MGTSGLKDDRLDVRTMSFFRQDRFPLEGWRRRGRGSRRADHRGRRAGRPGTPRAVPVRRGRAGPGQPRPGRGRRRPAAAHGQVPPGAAGPGPGGALPRHTVKFHLERLVEDGLLETEYRRLTGRRGPGAGRPAKLYRRSARQFDVTLPERHYDLAGRILAGAVDAAAATGQPVRAAVDDAATAEGRALADPGTPLVDVLAGLGYEPRDTGDGVVLGNCPFHDLAATHTELVCGMNLGLLEALLEQRAGEGRMAVLDPAPGRCCVVLTAP